MKTLNILSLITLLAGCGGGDFTSGSLGEGDGDAGPEGAGGDVTGVTGGVTGVAGGAGGAAPGTGGAAAGGQGGGTGGALGGSGSQVAGTGGTAAGGQPAGSGGAPLGGGTGSGGTGPACKPPVVNETNLPQEVVWEAYEGRYNMIPADMCLSCQNSPCTTCAVTWWPVTQSEDGLTLTATAEGTCGPVDISVGACGTDLSTSSCTTWGRGRYISTTLVFSLQPKADGSGYTAVYRTNSDTGGLTYPPRGACPEEAYNGMISANQPMWALFGALRDTVAAAEWPCGG